MNMNTNEIVASNLKLWLKTREMSQTDLVVASGLHANLVSEVVNCKRKMISFRSLDLIAISLEIPVYYLFQNTQIGEEQ